MDYNKLIVYSELEFLKFLNFKNFHSIEEIKTKFFCFDYFKEYLGKDKGLQATHMYVEDKYISKDFIDDYSDFYSTCFFNYSKECIRIHFFSSLKDEKQFEEKFQDIFLTNNNKAFWDQFYLGFVVVKPIPSSIIGYSLLKTYNHRKDIQTYSDKRFYWATRNYKIHLNGNDIELNSIAFQQQDSVMAACSTVSIWVLLHRASVYPFIPLKTPGEITKDAGTISSDGSRLIPNKEGLDVQSMCKAITKSKLNTEVRGSENLIPNRNLEIKKRIYAYSGLHLPIILAFTVPNENSMDNHAVAICGHSYKENKHKHLIFSKICNDISATASKVLNISKKEDIVWKAEDIDEIYSHDDQWGPFTRMTLQNETNVLSPWSEHLNIDSKGTTEVLIISIFPKVRIAYEDIERYVYGLNDLIKQFLKGNFKELSWGIRVMQSQEFKSEIRESNLFNLQDSLDKTVLEKILKKSFPRYVWIATCYSGNFKLFDFVFDATDYSGGILGFDIINYYPDLSNKLSLSIDMEILGDSRNRNEILKILPERFLIFIINHLRN